MALLEIRNLERIFITPRGPVEAIAGLSLDCRENEFLCIIGPSGCGKSSLLRIIAGLDRADRGTILFWEKAVTAPVDDVGMVFQNYSLFPWLTIKRNIMFGMKGSPREDAQKRCEDLLEQFSLAGFGDRYPYELSGGMQQRVAIARALGAKPSLLLMDEPFSALDEKLRWGLQEEFVRIWREQALTIVYVTHSIDEAVFLGTRVVVMKERPGAVNEDISIDMSHPRDRASPDFVEYHLKIRAALLAACSANNNSHSITTIPTTNN